MREGLNAVAFPPLRRQHICAYAHRSRLLNFVLRSDSNLPVLLSFNLRKENTSPAPTIGAPGKGEALRFGGRLLNNPPFFHGGSRIVGNGGTAAGVHRIAGVVGDTAANDADRDIACAGRAIDRDCERSAGATR